MEDIGYVVFLLLAISLVLLFAAWYDSSKCHSQFERSGMEVEWRLIGGCLVKLPDGTWIPGDQYRVIN